MALAAAAVKAGAGGSYQALDILAAAYAESGDFTNAVKTVDAALALARGEKDAAQQVSEMEARRQAYAAGKAWRQ